MERDLKAIEDARKALADLGIDVSDPESTFGTRPTEGQESSNRSNNYGRFEEMPMEILSMTSSSRNQYNGNYYYINGFIMGTWDFDGEFEYVEIYVNHEDNVDYKCMLIAGVDADEGWSDLMNGYGVTVYFKFMGYSNSLKMPYGKFEAYEEYSPF